MKTAVITGANAGIGFCAARQLAEQGLRVVLLCRNQSQAEQARQAVTEVTGNPEVYCEIADLSLMRDVKRAAGSLVRRFSSLDVLINNAADFDLSRKAAQFTGEGLETQFATNTLAPYYLTKLLLPNLRQSKDGRVLNISSQGLVVYPTIKLDFGNLGAQKTYNPAKTYYQTKLALLMNSLSRRDRLAGSGIALYAVRVTNVKIDMGRYNTISPVLKTMYKVKSLFSISPDAMARVYTQLAVGERLPGFCYDEKLREVRCNKAAYDSAAQRRLEALCEEMLQGLV